MEIPDSFYFERWDKSNIPIDMRGRDFRHYEPVHKTGEIALEAAKDFVVNFRNHYVSPERARVGDIPEDRHTIGKGLMFFGPNGSRKSTLAVACLTEVQYRSPSYRVHYIRFSEWLRALTDTFTKEPTERSIMAADILRKVELSHLVVLDDLGQEYSSTSDFNRKQFHELLRVRKEGSRPTIVTSNVSMDRMSGLYGESAESFIHEAFDGYPILGPDSRKQKD